ncbi:MULTISPECIES: CBS domain-containing protein [Pseudothermotoga]|uniref:Putative signal transduction protein with CBS domains n=2 Tax=Pseudothermotoga TaxID=1643951 RepID=A8F7Q5_PSELT|nr:putative signal transduction protein with CBS domains [Pseudothermotoga lettingae TMO]KUK21408.1 MAG: Putative signal transduction protein with CBS domain [Pseudothermotoga lettingae]GLI48867.1 serine/threonine protein kinase [Pseudothermotoga lettingae TMO]
MEKILDRVQSFFLDMPITEIMNSNVISVKPDRTLRQVKEILRIKRISGLPVVDSERKLIGIVSIEDIIKALEGGYVDDTVEERMTKNVVSIQSNSTLKDVIEVFEKWPYGRFPVVDSENKLVGIVTKNDVMMALLTKLGLVYLHDERRREVLDSPEYFARSLLTGERLDKSGADFYFPIDYYDINLAGIGASRLRQFLLAKGVDEKTARRVAIATYEAETNVVIHSGSSGGIYCFIKPDSVFVRVEDHGKGIEDVELAMREGYSTAPDYVRELGFGAGMGLANIKRCSDNMMVMSKVGAGVVVEMEFLTRKEDKG